MTASNMALAAYRHVLRSTRIAFQGDFPTLTAARLKARQGFESNRALATGSDEVTKNIQHAEDVALILRQNVVQGEAQAGDDSFKLRIHEETERGDNDSIKAAGKNTLSGGGKCCSA